MRTLINEISDQEIRERLNQQNLGYGHTVIPGFAHGDEPLPGLDRLYMEDGHHYEDEPRRILYLLKKEAERRGLRHAAIGELAVGTVIPMEWDAEMRLTEIHKDPYNNYAQVKGTHNCQCKLTAIVYPA